MNEGDKVRPLPCTIKYAGVFEMLSVLLREDMPASILMLASRIPRSLDLTVSCKPADLTSNLKWMAVEA
jgi:hypothetical protein